MLVQRASHLVQRPCCEPRLKQSAESIGGQVSVTLIAQIHSQFARQCGYVSGDAGSGLKAGPLLIGDGYHHDSTTIAGLKVPSKSAINGVPDPVSLSTVDLGLGQVAHRSASGQRHVG